jgi:large subunit ribosomal protein L25
METVELACEKRETGSKGMARALRRGGHIPAIIYGPKTVPIPAAISSADLKKGVLATGRQRLVRLKSSSQEINDKYVVFKELQRTPVSGEITHADLYEVDLQRRLRVSIPLRFTGRAEGVVAGGILQPLVRQVEVECVPLEIPESVEVDVTSLGIHDVIHISALKLAGNVKVIFDTDYALVSVLPPTVAEAPVVAAAPAEGAAAEAAVPAEGAAAPTAAEAAGAAPAKPGAAAAKKAP